MGTGLEVQNPESRLYELNNYQESDKFTHREKLALRYTDALLWDPTLADDEFWAELHEEFNEKELVELGYYASRRIGGQLTSITVQAEHGELEEALGRPVKTRRTTAYA